MDGESKRRIECLYRGEKMGGQDPIRKNKKDARLKWYVILCLEFGAKKCPMLGSMWMVKYRGNQEAKWWPWCGRYAAARTKNGFDSHCSTLCKLCSSLNIIEFQICDRPVAGIPYFSTFWCWLVFCVQLGGLRQAFTCLREELVNLSSTRQIFWHNDKGCLHCCKNRVPQRSGNFAHDFPWT